MRKLKLGMFFISIVVMAGACDPPSKLVAGQAGACNSNPQSMPSWVKKPATFLSSSAGDTTLPRKYTVYTIGSNRDSLQYFFQALKEGKANEMVIPLPGERGCSTFRVENSGLLSPALAAKYPELVSLKGTDIHRNSNIVRIDYDGTKLHIQMTLDGAVYLLEPYNDQKQGLLYLLFDKQDSRKQTGFSKGER